MFHESVIEALHAHAKRLWIMTGSLFSELLNQGLQLGVRRGVGDSRLQPDKGAEGNARIVGDLEREVDIGVFPSEARRQDSNNRVVLMDKLETPPDHRWVRVKMPLPKQVTENDNRLRVPPLRIVRRDQSAAQKGRYPEMTARVTGELNGRNILGQVFVRSG